MSTPSSLLGPPEIYREPTTATTRTTPATTGNPFVDLMVTNFNNATTPTLPPMAYTQNNSPTFNSTGNPCLDFFFHVEPDSPPEALTGCLNSAWDHNPLTTLKLVCNLRGVRGTGKSDKEGILEGPEVRREAKREWREWKSAAGAKRGGRRGFKQNKVKAMPFKQFKTKLTREARVLAALERMQVEETTARESREERKIAAAKKAVERYNRDPDYRFLYDRISDLFADLLKSDVQNLNANQLNKISLTAKWCQSLDSSFDKATLLCEGIARKVFPRELFKEYDDILDAHYAYRVRDRLRKEILVPLRKALELPEVYIGANKWGSLPYNRVASVAMKFYKEKFLKHDKKRFEEYLEKAMAGKATITAGASLPREKVMAGKATIAAGTLLPHEIIASLNDGDGGMVAEIQWKRMVDDLSKKGKMNNCLATFRVAWGAFRWSDEPKLQTVEGVDLRSKMAFVKRMEMGRNTDFQKVFDLILEVAVNGKLTEEQMIKRVFVFSGMDFGHASSSTRRPWERAVQPPGRVPWETDYRGMDFCHASSSRDRDRDRVVPAASRAWETDYQAIVRKFEEKGYGSSVPEVVFWNLRDSKATPVPGNQKGVVLVSGFSKNLMTVLLEESGSLNPEAVMEAAISGEEYKKLAVLD
ncbi:hypothetical protein Vadar_024841 [Vaccinium darrowii]|uniref:Uncharacterized protein n=1 Tax=Vaccinium darrowii TaxID=229202 RepID=A0ACB7YZ47_9ERIC|nr:hypothetical protein Vadar_024841 [Vaccinium darrowii]